MDGLLIVDKPVGPTSHDVVARVRRLLGEKRIGHTGTLDPAASGVLPLVIGRATRLARFLSGSDKEYAAEVALGTRTTTYDAEGEPVGERWAGAWPSRDEIERALDTFRGPFEQQPPAFSAKKIGGVRSYTIARRRPAVAAGSAGASDVREGADAPGGSLRPVSVTVRTLELVAVERDRLALRVVCSAGFYVRSLAHDLGERLGVGAHLAALRRTRSGDYGLETAIPLADAEADPGLAARAVVPLERLLTAWPAVVLTADGVRQVAFGRDIRAADVEAGAALPAAPRVRLLDAGGRLVAVAEATAPDVLHPAVVFV